MDNENIQMHINDLVLIGMYTDFSGIFDIIGYDPIAVFDVLTEM